MTASPSPVPGPEAMSPPNSRRPSTSAETATTKTAHSASSKETF